MRKLIAFFTCFCLFFGLIFFLSTNESPSSQKGAEDSLVRFIPPNNPHKKTVCLNMIVKNESPVIEKCLASVKGMIDYWVIVDTGSTDGTQQIIKNFMKDVPGKLYERPWVNFAHNRNEALDLARNKTDYIMLIDADEMLVFDKDFTKPALDKDVYIITTQQKGSSDYMRMFLLNTHLDWKWKGVIHEICESTQLKTMEHIKGVVNFSDTSAGNRSKDPKKYIHDAEVLEAALKNEPDNSRYQFYLAECYASAREFCMSLENYKKRAAMGGEHKEEVFWALFRSARIEEILNMPPKIFINSYWKAYNFRPTRIEPLYYLGSYYLRMKEYALAYDVLKKGLSNLQTNDILFVERWVYDWDLQYKLAQAAYYTGEIQEFRAILTQLLQKKTLPENVKAEIEYNLQLVR